MSPAQIRGRHARLSPLVSVVVELAANLEDVTDTNSVGAGSGAGILTLVDTLNFTLTFHVLK